MIIVREKLAWAAGLFEGEGCFSTSDRKHSRTIKAIVGSTDLDVLISFKAIIGLGQIRTKRVPIGHKNAWVWQVASFEDVQAIMALLWPWLHSRRRIKIKELLEWYHTNESINLKAKRTILPFVKADLAAGLLTQKAIATKFNISRTSVHRIKYGA